LVGLTLTTPAHATELLVRWTTVADGLPVSWTSAVVEDSEGNIWTRGPLALSRFDGVEIAAVDLAGAMFEVHVLDLERIVDPQG
jgi:hypothetical protein